MFQLVQVNSGARYGLFQNRIINILKKNIQKLEIFVYASTIHRLLTDSEKS